MYDVRRRWPRNIWCLKGEVRCGAGGGGCRLIGHRGRSGQGEARQGRARRGKAQQGQGNGDRCVGKGLQPASPARIMTGRLGGSTWEEASG